MHPDLITIHVGNFFWLVKSYSFSYFLATLTVIIGIYDLGLKKGFEKNKLIVFLIAILISGFAGARFLHFLTNMEAYFSGEYDIFSLHMKGFAISGGIIGAALTGYLSTKKMKLNFWELGDISAVFLGLGIAIARIGCFLNGCCFGKTTNLPWGVKFPYFSQAHQYQIAHGMGNFFGTIPVHPTQIYEALAAIAGSLLSGYLIYKKNIAGTAILFFGLWFSFFRLVNMQLRIMPETFDAPVYFYPIFYISIMLACGGFLYWRNDYKKIDK